MSLSGAQLIAFSGLSATQTQISVASSNISNADTTGYTVETANQVATVTGGIGTGVAITGVSTNIDQLLLKSLIGATSALGSADTTNNYLSQLEQLYGTVDGSTTSSGTTGSSPANLLASFESALSALAANPSSASLQLNAVSALTSVTTQLNQISSGIQQLRGNADQAISSSVQSVNTDLKQIADLNTQIKQAAAAGLPTGQLQDERNTALQDIATKMNVNYFTNANGDVQIYTPSGQPLLDSAVHQLSFTPAGAVTQASTYSATPPSSLSGITVNGVDITSQITSGNIGALFTLRDTSLPNAQSQLDQLATQLTSSVNAVSNQGTAMPPPSSLTGTAAVNPAGTDSISGSSGTVRLAVTDSSGKLVSYQDLSLSGITTVGQLVTAINSGTSGLTASISSGHLVITAPSGDSVAINEMTSSVGSSGEGFSQYFGLNDLLTGTGAANIAVRSDIAAGTAGLPTATLDSSATPTVGNQVLPSGSATIDNALYAAMTQSTNFATVGGLAATTTSFANYAASIVSFAATASSQATSAYTLKQTVHSTYANSLSSESGVNIDEETSRMTSLQNKYAAASEMIQAINTMYNSLITAMQSI